MSGMDGLPIPGLLPLYHLSGKVGAATRLRRSCIEARLSLSHSRSCDEAGLAHCCWPPAFAPDGGVSGISGVGVGDDPAPAGGKPPFSRGIPAAGAPDVGGSTVGASAGGTAPVGPEAAEPGAAPAAPLAGTPMSGGTDAGNGADACACTLDAAGAAADAGTDTAAGADADDACSGFATGGA